MADFAYLFGIRPWEWDRLTLGEVEGLMRAVDTCRHGLEER